MAVDILDIVVDITTPPIERAAKHNEAFRVIGIGFLGFADWMAKNSLSYESEEAMEEVSNYFERFAIYALKATIKRAKLLGNFPLYDKSEWAKGKLYGKSIAWYRENAAYPEEWEVLYEEQKEFGVRNLQLFAIAPNSSTGLVQGVTPSILPPWDVVYMDSSSLGNLLKMPLYIKDKQWYYKPYKYYSRTSMINFVSTVQKWIDSGISFEVVFDLNKDTIADIFNFYIDAWENNIKGIYYIRFIQPNGELQEKEESCTFCAN
jgi:ribonucleoside-diphosphate reductase alpha chain